MNVYRRLDGFNQDKHEWVKHVENIVDKYNPTEHSTIQIKSNEEPEPEPEPS